MRILVTGGAGFIGSHVVEAAVSRGHTVGVLDNLSTGKRDNIPEGVDLYEADLRDREHTASVLSDFRPDAISHQAAQASVTVSVRDPAGDATTNVLGTLHLLEAAVSVGTKRVVFASTGGAIYGEVREGTRASELTVPNPKSPYAISKLTAERYLAFYGWQHQLGFNLLRYANVYGPRQDAFGEAGVVAIFVERTRRGEPLQINARSQPSDGGCVRDYVYVGDVARANILALEGHLEAPVLNLGTGVGVTTEELARAVQDALGQSTELLHAEPRIGDLERSVLDPSLAVAELGTPTELKVGLRLTVAWAATKPQAPTA
jgi:UDP-glucose 4-epimerase